MKKYRIIGGIVLCVIIVCVVSVLVRNNADSYIKEEIAKRVEAEFRFKQLVKDYAALRSERDSLNADREKLVTIIDFQKKNPQIIINKYETSKKYKIILNCINNTYFIIYYNNIFI